MTFVNSVRAYVFAVSLVAVFVLSGTHADAQTKRHKRTARPLPAVTITQPQIEPQVISRADEFPDQNSQAIPPPVDSRAVGALDDPNGRGIEELRARVNSLEASNSKDPDQKQKKLLLYLDILTKAEQRSESLRKQVFDMIEKETNVKTRLDSIDLDIRPESIEKNVALAGSLRPEELRESRRKSLTAERTNLQALMVDIQRTRSILEQNLQRADSLVERLRTKLDKDIDDVLTDDTVQKPD